MLSRELRIETCWFSAEGHGQGGTLGCGLVGVPSTPTKVVSHPSEMSETH